MVLPSAWKQIVLIQIDIYVSDNYPTGTEAHVSTDTNGMTWPYNFKNCTPLTLKIVYELL